MEIFKIEIMKFSEATSNLELTKNIATREVNDKYLKKIML